MIKRVQPGRGGLRVVDGGGVLVETVNPWFVQDGPTDPDRVRFKPPDRARVPEELADKLASANACVVVEEAPEPKRKGKAKEDKARRSEEDKGA